MPEQTIPRRTLEHRPGQELRSLTALRGIAAMAVVTQHFSATAQGHCRETIPSLAPHGYLGVDFFFVLSGFIMAFTYGADFQARGARALAPFIAKRVARIVPLNTAVLALLVLAGMGSLTASGRNVFFSAPGGWSDVLANALMLQGLGIGANLNGPSWSVSAEFAAYLLFPGFVALVSGRRAWRSVAVGLAVAALCLLASARPRLELSFEAPPQSLVRCFSEFVLGMASCRLLGNARAVAALRRDATAFGLAAAAAGLLAARLDLPFALLMPLVVASFAVNDGLAARVTQARFFYFLGVISFSLYLVHSPFRPLALELLRAVAPAPVGPVAALAFALAGSLSVIFPAWAMFVWVERPGRQWGRKLLGAAPRLGTRARQPVPRPAA